MIKFLLKGLLRDKSRSLLPVIVVATGVTLTVFLHAYLSGFMGDTIELTAKFSTGHLKVMTKAYAKNMTQIPNDLALVRVDSLLEGLNQRFPDIEWSPRIQFGGLIDSPDEKGETKQQGAAMGVGLDLLSENTRETERLNLKKSLARGKLPDTPGEALLSEQFSRKLKVNPGDRVTLISSTMFGGMAFYNFVVSGTLVFGQEALDRGAIIADIEDVRKALDMEDAAGEILGFFKNGFYNDELAIKEAEKFKEEQDLNSSDYAPVMVSLSGQSNMGTYVKLMKTLSTYISLVFILAMSLVLWNAGLLGGLRRYGEVGIRLAMGEEKGHVYRTLITESVMIGIIGTVFGTIFGLSFSWILQKYGIDISGMMKGSALMLPQAIRARITPVDFYLGFFPGILSTVLGTMLSGIGIYKRQTARLFKELEA
jgi:putative ABC transport system permease protein